ncbi:hypothetical protein EUTSA_v10022139mg, partial [Eutrema salsugineum]
SPDGDLIDCIYFEAQPALRHPLLRNHKIKEVPRVLSKRMNEMKEKRVRQVWNQNGTSCPDETVPIRRDTRPGPKPTSKKRHLTDARVSRQGVPYPAEEGHEYAIAYSTSQAGIYGAHATMNLWAPAVEPGSGEFSLSQIWLVTGHYNGSDLNTIEAGWQVFPKHYHDSLPRLFVYWTRDTYQKTGCLNLDCPGFVQVPSDYAIGAAFAPISSYGSNQYDITMAIWKDTDNGNWWLGIGQSFVGYWPASLFTHLADGPAKLVQWGGEITNTRSYGQQTTTQMGSGHFPEEGFGKASFFRKLRIIDPLYHLVPVDDFLLQTLNPTCYNAIKAHNEAWGTHFFYGGPGFNALCP